MRFKSVEQTARLRAYQDRAQRARYRAMQVLILLLVMVCVAGLQDDHYGPILKAAAHDALEWLEGIGVTAFDTVAERIDAA